MSWDALQNAASAIASMLQNKKAKQQQQSQFDAQMTQQQNQWQQGFDLQKLLQSSQQKMYDLQMQDLQTKMDTAKGSLITLSSPYGEVNLNPYNQDGTKKTTAQVKTEYDAEVQKLYNQRLYASQQTAGSGSGSGTKQNQGFTAPSYAEISAYLQKHSGTYDVTKLKAKYNTPEKQQALYNQVVQLAIQTYSQNGYSLSDKEIEQIRGQINSYFSNVNWPIAGTGATSSWTPAPQGTSSYASPNNPLGKPTA